SSGKEAQSASAARLKTRRLPACNWFPGLPAPWNWLPLKMVTAIPGTIPPTGSRMPARPGGSGLPGMCHALPRFAILVTPRNIMDRILRRLRRWEPRPAPVSALVVDGALGAVHNVGIHELDGDLPGARGQDLLEDQVELGGHGNRLVAAFPPIAGH